MRVNRKHLSILAMETMACYEVLKCVYSFTSITEHQLCDEHKSRFWGTHQCTKRTKASTLFIRTHCNVSHMSTSCLSIFLYKALWEVIFGMSKAWKTWSLPS